MNFFDKHEKAKYWSHKNIVTPDKISKYSKKNFLFNCINCNHEFYSCPNNVTSGCWCPYCSKPPKKLCDNNECIFCFNNSFASYEKAKFIVNNEVTPRKIFKFSNKMFNFKCDNCFHIFSSKINDITFKIKHFI